MTKKKTAKKPVVKKPDDLTFYYFYPDNSDISEVTECILDERYWLDTFKGSQKGFEEHIRDQWEDEEEFILIYFTDAPKVLKMKKITKTTIEDYNGKI